MEGWQWIRVIVFPAQQGFHRFPVRTEPGVEFRHHAVWRESLRGPIIGKGVHLLADPGVVVLSHVRFGLVQLFPPDETDERRLAGQALVFRLRVLICL